MRVLFLVNHDVVIYNFRLEIVERLLREGHEVVISSPYGERIDDLVALGCLYEKIDFDRHAKNPFSDLKILRTYKKLLKKVRPDIVFTFTIKPNIYGGMACARKKIPYVVNVTGLGTAVENPGLLQKISIFLYRIALRRAQRVFFQNTENLAFFAKHRLAIGKSALLPGSGVNLERFSPMPYPDEEEGVSFAFISRIMKEKGIDQYLDAARAIREKHPNTRFHVCGFCEGDYEEILRKAEADGVIVYHGMVRNVREIYEKIHCTVHPTYYPEGVSNVLLESCASCRPIITTDRSGCREVVDDGKNGFVVAQKNSADLIEKIERFLALSHEEKAAMGEAARRKVEKEFDRGIVVRKYMEELKK